jgi:cytidyltransferase-like protein
MSVEKLVDSRIKLREVEISPIYKLLSLDESVEFIKAAHTHGKTVVLLEGTWDLTHPGHVQHIREAKKHADLVVLKLASAEYATKYKGADRPIEKFRDMVVSEFENVDAVFVEEKAIPPDNISENARVLVQLNPDKVAMEIEDEHFFLKIKAVDYANRHLGAKIEPVVMVLPYIVSTTAIVEKIHNLKPSASLQ